MCRDAHARGRPPSGHPAAALEGQAPSHFMRTQLDWDSSRWRASIRSLASNPARLTGNTNVRCPTRSTPGPKRRPADRWTLGRFEQVVSRWRLYLVVAWTTDARCWGCWRVVEEDPDPAVLRRFLDLSPAPSAVQERLMNPVPRRKPTLGRFIRPECCGRAAPIGALDASAAAG